uniref:Uncharacterized protein n=1 Tax=Arundo donax TaxID=35708 RepID=A0A0A9H9D1_ARUDO
MAEVRVLDGGSGGARRATVARG